MASCNRDFPSQSGLRVRIPALVNEPGQLAAQRPRGFYVTGARMCSWDGCRSSTTGALHMVAPNPSAWMAPRVFLQQPNDLWRMSDEEIIASQLTNLAEDFASPPNPIPPKCAPDGHVVSVGAKTYRLLSGTPPAFRRNPPLGRIDSKTSSSSGRQRPCHKYTNQTIPCSPAMEPRFDKHPGGSTKDKKAHSGYINTEPGLSTKRK